MCGLYGIINSKPRKFDRATFNILGNINDSRGGDSCGIFIDGETEYGVEQDDKLFANYFLKSELLKNTKESLIALGHCRKTSPGMRTGLDQAQPVVIREKGTDRVLMVVIHNGTIYNYEALAKKYIPDVNIDGWSDTQVMAHIFFYKGYDVLEEYNGGAAFCIVDYRGNEEFPKVYFWRGESRMNEYPINSEPKEERPLEFVEYKGSLYFSSIGYVYHGVRVFESLLTGCGTVYKMYGNTLVQFIPGKGLELIKKYDRSKQYQSKAYSSTTYSPQTPRTHTTTSRSTEKETYAFYDGVLFQTSTTNIYTRKGKKVHGKAIINTAGKFQREEGKDSRVLWFYDGIALDLDHGKQYFKFLEYLRKKSGLTQDEFVKKFENPIRRLSFDRLFFKESVMMKATGTTECEIYSGPFHMIGNSTGELYKEGKRDWSNIYQDSDYIVPFTRYKTEERDPIDLPKFREECISLMN